MQLAVDYCEMTGADYYIYCRLNGDPIVVRSSHAIQGQTQLNVSFAVEDTLVFEQETGCNMRLGQENQ